MLKLDMVVAQKYNERITAISRIASVCRPTAEGCSSSKLGQQSSVTSCAIMAKWLRHECGRLYRRRRGGNCNTQRTLARVFFGGIIKEFKLFATEL